MRRIAWLPAWFGIFFTAHALVAALEEPTSAPADEATSRPAVSVVDSHTLNAVAIDAAIVHAVSQVSDAIAVIEVDRRPASISRRGTVADNRWISYGAGVFLHADGRILTCQHLIDGAAEITVILHDGRRLSALRIAEDRRSDLAVIRAVGAGFDAAPIGEAERLNAGTLVLSFGNPLGLASDGRAAVGFGIVSAMDRSLPPEFGSDQDRFYGEMIQTSILAGPGSSGGPLVSLSGEIVGVIAAVPTKGGNLSPISFAIPMTQRNRKIVQDLSEGRAIEHGYLGVEVDVLTYSEREAAKLAERVGVRIAAVFADGPADRAGLRAGDIVSAIRGKPVYSVDGFVSLIGSLTAGERTTFDVIRDTRNILITATLTKRPDVPDQRVPEAAFDFRGATLGRVDPAMRSVANLPEFAMLVLRIEAESSAGRAGLVPGDVIVRADGRNLQPDVANQLLATKGDVMLSLASGATIIVKP
ncbi:MAG: trypsin-like peptidase domain-containing protein [Phycisphaerales bacterium]|nr:trypsin-like peptidase domain-containing protein [Phycisphaerales bacterium]MCB9855444.1 trypsin-like peptidase domain-containing protein [Phycisphaerales bacterium]